MNIDPCEKNSSLYLLFVKELIKSNVLFFMTRALLKQRVKSDLMSCQVFIHMMILYALQSVERVYV